jgi:tetratricopeptide (TPR) repeat protein
MFRQALTRKISITLLLALVLTSCGGAEGRKAKYLERGKAQLQEEKYDKAKVEFRNVLQIDPKNADAYFYLGQIEEKQRNIMPAFGYYTKAVELAPNNLDAQSRLGRIYLLGGELNKAKEIADLIISKDAGNTNGKLLIIAINFKQGNDAQAIRDATQLVAENPALSEAAMVLAAIYKKQNQLEKSAEILEKSLSTNHNDIGLYIELANLYSGMKLNDKAEAASRKLITLKPDDLTYRMSLATFLTKTNQMDKAEESLRDAIRNKPEDVRRYLMLVDFIAARRSAALAEKELISSIQKLPDSPELRFTLANLYEQAGVMEKAELQYKEIISQQNTKPPGLKARTMLASLILRRGNLHEGAVLIDEVLKENPGDNEALILKGKIALQQGRALDAIAQFRSVLKDQPNSTDVLALLAEAHLKNNEPALAKDSLQKATEANPKDANARLNMAAFFVQSKDLGSALKEIDAALAIAPKDIRALQTKAEILATKQDFKGAEKQIAVIKSAYPTNPLGYHRMGQLYLAQKKYDLALQEFDLALKQSPGAADPLAAAINVLQLQNKADQAIVRLEGVLKSSPDHQIANKLLGEIYLSQRKFAEAEKIFRHLIQLNPKWNIPYSSVALLNNARGDTAGAINVINDGLKAIPDDMQLLLSLASVYENARDYPKAIEGYERVLKKFPDNAFASNNLASILADQKGDAESLKRAMKLAAPFESSTQPAFMDTLGWVYYKSGETDKAVALLKKVIEKAPNVPVFQYHLGMAYQKVGDSKSAKTYLAKAVDTKTNFPGVDEARKTLASLK